MAIDANERRLGIYWRGFDPFSFRVPVFGLAAAGFQTARPVDSNARDIHSGYEASRHVLSHRAQQSHRRGRFRAGSVLH